MRSIDKGNALEAKVFALFKAEVSNGRFFAKEEYCKIYSKKGYYSRDRKRSIIFDISIEIFLPGHQNYSILVLIECKNYNHSVPVDDVEEFHSKIQQVAGANVKGILVSTNSFQEGTFNFCESKGIGLVRYYDESQHKWELSRSPSSMISVQYAKNDILNACKGLTIESYKAKYFDCYCYASKNFTNSLFLFFQSLLMEKLDETTNTQLQAIRNAFDDGQFVPYLTDSVIEDMAHKVLSSISYKNGAVPLSEISDWQKQEKGLRVLLNAERLNNSQGDGVLGKISFESNEIVVFSDKLSQPERHTFTLAHEFGHWFLDHGKYMTGEYCEAQDFDFEESVDIGIKDIMRMELQANRFASCLLLPKETFLADVCSIACDMKLQDRGFGFLFLDNQRCNLDSYHKFTNVLKKKYAVSRSVVKIRLQKLGILKESPFNQSS